MINARELRVGNFVNYNGKKACVTHVSDNHIGLSFGVIHDGSSSRSEHSIVKSELLNAIPLTEDILLKLGFEKMRLYDIVHYHYCYTYFTLYEMNENHDFALKYGEIVEYNYSNIMVDSLHKLQNLHYILIDEELKIDVDNL